MKHKRILIVDDDHDFAESMAELIEIEGHETILAHSGKQAIDIFKQNNIDIIFIDVRMPGINGVETFKEMHGLNPDVRVAMMTGFSDQQLLNEAMEMGAIGILDKPIDIERLMEMIEGIDCYKKILLVDDDHDFADSLKLTLESNGHKVITAYNMKEAFDYAENQWAEILLLDIRLNDHDGLEIFHRLRQDGLNVPTIIITAFADDYINQLEEIKSMPQTEIVNKPIKSEMLLNKIETIGTGASY